MLRACAALFGGDVNAAKTLRELCDRTDSVDALRRRLLGHFYAGLYHDALDDAERAKRTSSRSLLITSRWTTRTLRLDYRASTRPCEAGPSTTCPKTR